LNENRNTNVRNKFKPHKRCQYFVIFVFFVD